MSLRTKTFMLGIHMGGRLAKGLLLGVLIVISSSTSHSRVFGDEIVRTIALSGALDPATGATFTRLLTSGELNNRGETVFRGELAGEGVNENNNLGIWKYDGDSGLKLFLREGSDFGGAGSRFTGFGLPTINNNGRIAFSGTAMSGAASYAAVWSQATDSGLNEVARAGSIAPGTDQPFSNFTVHLADNGTTVVYASLIDFFGDEGLWRDDGSSSLTPIYVERHNAPGTNTTFTSFGGYSVNDQSQLVLVSGILDVHGGATQTAGIWRDGTSGLQLVARHGDTAPGTAAQFDAFGFGPQPILDVNGRASFVAHLMGTGVNGTNDSGIWSERNGNGLELVVRSGSGNAPGTTARFETFGTLVQNSKSQLAFHGNLGGGSSGTNNQGIWSERDGAGMTLVAREGNLAPGSELRFYSFAGNSLALNDHGQVAFLADIRESTTNPRVPQFTGIWAHNRQGMLQLIALEGGLLNVSDNPSQPDLRTITSLEFRPAGLNDLGQLTFFATFTDGSSGIFISDLAAVPEPQIASMILPVIIGLVASRRRTVPRPTDA